MSHGAKLHQNPRFCVGKCFHDLGNVSVNVEMLVFADRYNIQPLVKFCQNHLKNSVTKENFMDIVKAADVINDKDLMQAAAKFASLNIGKFDNDPEIKNFIKTNPECFANIWELMMFK